jgi:hypothetical protein
LQAGEFSDTTCLHITQSTVECGFQFGGVGLEISRPEFGGQKRAFPGG